MNDMTVANTIWKQISTATKMACGARDPTGDKDHLSFRVGAERDRLGIRVWYEYEKDTYRVELVHTDRKWNFSILENHDDVYVDALNEVIYHAVNK